MDEDEHQDLDQIRYAISHEIRGALTVSKGYSEFAKKGKFGAIDQKLLDALNTIERTTDKITTIATNLNEFIRFKFQNAKIRREEIQIGEIIEKMVQKHNLEALKKRITISADINESLLFSVDPQALELVLTNILGNAIQFSSENTKIFVFTENVNEVLSIKVQDQGQGLSESDLTNIWLNPKAIKTHQSKKGACFGLRVSKMLIEQHNGSIDVTSSGKNHGTTVVLQIPP